MYSKTRIFIFFVLFSLISISAFANEKQKSNIVGLDVRSKAELFINEAPGAIHIPTSDLSKESLSKIDKNAEIKVFCESGGRAGRAKKKLESLGFKNVKNIGSWRDWNKNFSSKEK